MRDVHSMDRIALTTVCGIIVARVAARTTTAPEHVRGMTDIVLPEAAAMRMVFITGKMDMADITTEKKSITVKDTTKPDWGGE